MSIDIPALPPMVREDPIIVAIAVLAAIVVLIGTALFIRWLRRPPGVRLWRALAKPDALTVLMHPNPDPDAMAAAIGVARLAEQAGTSVTIRYPGQIRHQENRAFRTVLDCEFESIDDAAALDDEGAVVLVDHNTPRGFAGCDWIDPYVVIDHHPGEATAAAFTDIRSDYGACASIVAEYFDDLGAEPNDPDRPNETNSGDGDIELSSRVATGLVYGIMADTANLSRGCTTAEFDAMAYLHPGVDEDAIDRIAHPEVDAEVLEVKARAILEREVRGPFALSNVGTVTNADAIPQAADELLCLEGITAVVVMGKRNGTLHLSGRSRDDRIHMGNMLATAVEDVPMADAGGHSRMGGGQIPLTHLTGLRPKSGLSSEEFKDRLFDAMAGKAHV